LHSTDNEETDMMIKTSTLALALSLAAATGLAAFPDRAGAKTAAPASARLAGDGESLAFLVAVDNHEIEGGAQALAKGVGGGVADFARKMQAEHGQNLADTRKVARDNKVAIVETAAVKAQKAKGRAESARLAKLSGAAYQRAYVDAMVKGHAEVLDLIDTKLVAQSADPDVVAHLKATRSHVVMHLEAAKALQVANP
jgi:putative membrane protein